MERQEQYVTATQSTAKIEQVAPLENIAQLSEDERRLVLRYRQCRASGYMMIVDGDSMTMHVSTRPEYLVPVTQRKIR